MDPEKKQHIQKSLNKKAIVIVGRMGHGKSSFLKMLIQKRNDFLSFQQVQKQEQTEEKSQYDRLMSGQQKKEILICSGGKNGTFESQFYEVHPSHELLKNGETLYAIDTPGLDSDEAACLITEQIDDIIVENKFQIVAIAYIIDISTREQGRNGHSYFGQFFRLLKLKHKYKDNLIFCVATKWDKHYQQPESVGQYLKSLKQILQKNHCVSAYNKLIRWSSKPLNDFSRYRRRFLQDQSQEGIQIVRRQWKELSQKIQSQNSGSLCPIEEYLDDHRKFWDNILLKIMNLFQRQTRTTAFQKQECIFPIKINRQKIKIKAKNVVIPIFTSGALNMARFSLAFILPPLALTGPVGITIMTVTLAVGAAFTAKQVLKKLMINHKSTASKEGQLYDDGLIQKTKRQLQAKLNLSITNNLCDELISKLQFQDNKIKLPKLYWLQQAVHVSYADKPNAPFAIASRQNPFIKTQLDNDIKQFKIVARTKVWMPKLESMIKIFKEVTQQIYANAK